MFKIKKIFKVFKNKDMETELTREQFKKLANEIRGLTELIGKIWIANNEFQIKLKRIQQEMDQLEKIVENRFFSHLPEKKKRELKRSLIISKQELIKCIEEAPCPTDRKQ
ncbi:hypothetical protein JCM12298_30180 [Desulfothermus naphthae]